MKKEALMAYNNTTSNIWQDLNSWGINIYDDFWEFSPWQIEDESNEVINKLLNKVVNNILSWASNDSERYRSWFEKAKSEAKNATEEILED